MAEDIISLAGKVESETVHNDLRKYIDKRLNAGASFTYQQFGFQEREKMRKLEVEREIKLEQERKYREMIEAEHAKADLLKKQLKELEELEELKFIEKEMFADYQKKCKEEVPEEPKAQETVVNIRFRLPNGSTVVRNFRPSDPIKLMKSYLHSREDLALQQDIQLMYDYPPKPVPLEESANTPLTEFFNGSVGELITVIEHQA